MAKGEGFGTKYIWQRNFKTNFMLLICLKILAYFKTSSRTHIYTRDRPIFGYTDYLNRYRLIGIGIPHIGIGNGKYFRAGNRLDKEFSRFND